ncbi:hypothetical protein CCACVL1_07748 [Corchorus capsularis]|uniref:Uncharacterized protein n=1 Tax=Corchorus capsularis TaxID=210143 RepID=A0A1R3J434_COCAP|nr:hypothetical protein CCACVL1_07748 [Corchorus capsularis]
MQKGFGLSNNGERVFLDLLGSVNSLSTAHIVLLARPRNPTLLVDSEDSYYGDYLTIYLRNHFNLVELQAYYGVAGVIIIASAFQAILGCSGLMSLFLRVFYYFSLLSDLIQEAPVISRNIRGNTKEMLALRCLEELFGANNSLTNVAPPDSRVTFDLSLSCNDVLQQILREVSIPKLKRACPELLRWDVHPFIMHKRASLPKCALEQLKDTILNEIHVLDGDKNGPKWWPDDSDDENSNQEGNLIPQVHENDNEVLQDRLLEKTLTPSKRCGSDLIAANLVGAVNGNKDSICNDLLVNAKKFKQEATCTVQSFEQIPITLNGDEQLEDETERSTKGTEMEGDNMRKDSQAGEGEQISNAQNADIMVEQNVVMVVPSHVENAVLQKSPSGDANDFQVNAEKFKKDATCTVQSFEQIPISLNGDEQLDDETERSTKVTEMEGDNTRKYSQAGEGNQMENAQNVDMMVEQTCGDRPFQNVVMVVPSHVENAALQKNPGSDAKENFNQGFPLSCPISSSVDGLQQNHVPVKANADMEHPRAEQMSEHEDERIDIALEKSLFLSSQCTPSQDPLGKSGMTEQNFCVKCNKKGKVLYLEAKHMTSLARKEVAAFLELCSKKLTLEPWKSTSHPRLNADEDLVGTYESGHLGQRECNFICQDRVVNHGSSAACLNGDKLCLEKETFMVGVVHAQGEKNEEEEKMEPGQTGHEHQSMREHEHQQDQLPANPKCSNDNLTGENTVPVPANEVEVEEIAKEVVQPQDSDPPQVPASAVNSDGEESSTAANDKFIISAYPIRAKKHEPKYTSPPIPQLRRKKLPWTKTEEEMLKKGVKKFGSYGRSMPWTKILDFGTSVFLKGRTAIDLKDKWRNMSKVSPRCK